MISYLPSGRPVLVLATKADKLNQSGRRAAIAAIEQGLRERVPEHVASTQVIAFSAVSREGVEAADAVLAQWLAA